MMRIDRLDLISYGHLSEQTLDLSRPASGLTVVLGPNESGKSTTLRAIRALLFGIERGNPDDYRMGREGLRIGAALRDGDGVLHEVVRQGLSKAPLVTPDGARVDEAFLAALIGNVERTLFSTLFCVDHDELHDESAQLLDPDAEIGRLVFGASLGAAPLARVLRDLDGRADGLYRPRGSTQLVAKSLGRARQLTQEMRQLRVRAREWEQAESDLKRLDKEAARLRASVAELRGRESRLQRLTTALPLLARRAVAEESMAALLGLGAVQTDEWAEAVGQARAELVTAEREQQQAAAARDRLREQLGGLPASSPLLVAAERIDVLLQGVGRFRKDRDDLPGLRGQLASAQRSLTELLERLGIDEQVVRAVTDGHVAAVEELIEKRQALGSRLDSARAELSALDQSLLDARRDVEGLPEAPDTAALERVTAVARADLERERQAVRERGELRALAGDVQVQASALGLAPASLAALESVPAPAPASLRAHRQAVADLEALGVRLQEQLAEFERQREDLLREAAAMRADAAVPEPGEVQASRDHRDQGWALVRAAWLAGAADAGEAERWASGLPLADAYEGSVQDADSADDRRYAHASQLATLERLAAESVELQQKIDGVTAELAGTDETAARLGAQWSELWKPSGVLPASVDEAEEWLAGLADLKRAAQEHRRRAVALEELDADLAGHAAAVREALQGLGRPPVEGSLALLVEQASEVVAAAQVVREARAEKQRVLEQGARERPRREEAVRFAERDVAAWEGTWTGALAAVGMTGTTGLAAGRETLRLLREYRVAQKEADSLRGRVEGVGADIEAFSAKVAALVGEVAPDLLGLDPDRALSAIKPRLDEAREDGRLRQDVEARLGEAEAQVEGAELVLTDAGAELSRLRQTAALDEAADLEVEAARAHEHAALAATVRELDERLVEQAGTSVAELAREVGDLREAEVRLATDLGDVGSQLDGEDQRLEDVNRQVGDARTRLASLDHQGRAAALEQDAELELSVVARHVSDYARVALAAEILRRVVADYGQRNQGPIIAFASRNFSTLTDGAFDALLTDYAGDRQVLLARRANGEHLHIDQLSEGTVDQLYLALRLAGIEHHLSQAAAGPPVVLDDILVNFDDARAAAALRLCADLGGRAQVLLFTHHPHVVALAQRTLPGDRLHVAELGPRDHAALFVAPERPAPRAVRAAGPAGAGGEAAQQAILGVLRAAKSPLGRADILERAGIGESAWTPAIRALVESGAVVQEGVKRGARYSVGG